MCPGTSTSRPSEADRERETPRSRRRRRRPRQSAAAGPRALRPVRPPNAGRLFRDRRERAQVPLLRRAHHPSHRPHLRIAGGTRLDKAVGQAFLDAVTPAAVAATAGAIRELEDQHQARLAGSDSRWSEPSMRPSGPSASSTRVSPRTGSSRERWSASSKRRSPPSSESNARWPRSSAHGPCR